MYPYRSFWLPCCTPITANVSMHPLSSVLFALENASECKSPQKKNKQTSIMLLFIFCSTPPEPLDSLHSFKISRLGDSRGWGPSFCATMKRTRADLPRSSPERFSTCEVNPRSARFSQTYRCLIKMLLFRDNAGTTTTEVSTSCGVPAAPH